MKTIKRLITHSLFILLASVLFSCHNHTYENIIVVGVEEGDKNYKYKYELDFFVGNQFLYSNEVYHVGDTLNAR
jgi:hypothetical protein